MIGRLWVNKCQMCHWRASSLLFMPNRCNVLALFIKWASRAFLNESRLLRISSIGMRRTSLIEWPASDTGVVVLSCWWFRIERLCSPQRSLRSWRYCRRARNPHSPRGFAAKTLFRVRLQYRQLRRLPTAFIELTFGLSDALKVAFFIFFQVYENFWVARYGVGDFSSFVSCKKKYSLFDPLVVNNKWGSVGGCIFNSCGLLAGGIFVRQCRMD